MKPIPRILHCLPSLHPKDGGPSGSVARLVDSLARNGAVSVGLLSQTRMSEPTVPGNVSEVERRVVTGTSRAALVLGLPIRKELQLLQGSFRPALVHGHGIWQPANHWVACAARAWDLPLIIHPRGMLDPWALDQKALKKRLALALFQRRDLETARAFVATSEMECEHLRRLGLRQPVAVVPNGVDVVARDGVSTRDERRPEAHRVALFLSRVHPKKGVLELVQAWSRVTPAGWRLCIAGPDEGGHWKEVSRLVERLGLGTLIEYVGPVEGEQKSERYRRADLFLLPTFSENFGVVAAEALSYGLPVITTRGAPWADLETFRCGWWIETGVNPLVAALREAIALSDHERREMGERGRAYVRRYDWERIAEQTVALYRWVLGYGERPECVRID